MQPIPMDVDIASELRKWAVDQLNLVTYAGAHIPSAEDFEKVCRGKNKDIWTFVVNHVRSRSTVLNIKRKLHLHHVLRLRKHPNSVETIAEVTRLKQAISLAEAKKARLEQVVSDLEISICESEKKLNRVKNELDEVRDSSSLLQMYIYHCEKIGLSFRLLTTDIKHKIHRLKPTNSVVDHVTHDISRHRLLQNSPYLTPSRNNFSISLPSNGIQKLVGCVRSNFYVNGNINQFQADEGIIRNVKDAVIWYCASDIVSCLSNQAEASMTLNQGDFVTIASTSVSACLPEWLNTANKELVSVVQLKKLKLSHINQFFQIAKTANLTSKILQEKNVYFQNLCKQLSQHKTSDEVELIQSLISTDERVECMAVNIQILKELIQQIRGKTALCRQRNEESICELQKLKTLLVETTSNRKMIQKLLNENQDMISLCGKKHGVLQSFSLLFTTPSRSLTKDYANEVKKSLFLNKQKYDNIMRKLNCLQDSNCLIYPSAIEQVCSTFGMRSFHSSDVLLPNCVELKKNMAVKKQIYSAVCQLLKKVRVNEIALDVSYSKSFCESELKRQVSMLQQLSDVVRKEKGWSQKALQNCCAAESVMNEWWEQQAQFIPNIVIEGHTLNEFLKLLATNFK